MLFRSGLAAGVEFLDRLLARLDCLGKTDLVVFGEQGVLTDVGQVEPDEVFIISVDAIFGHSESLFEVWRTDGTSPETHVTIPTIRGRASGELKGYRSLPEMSMVTSDGVNDRRPTHSRSNIGGARMVEMVSHRLTCRKGASRCRTPS